MPNPKTGTVTPDIAKAVKEIKAGKVEFRVDKTGIIHAPIGKMSFPSQNLIENAHALVDSVVRAKPSAAKGKFLKSVTMSSTMGPGITIDTSSRDGSGEALMAVTTSRAKKPSSSELEGSFKGTESAILVDYRGLKVPEVTELRRQVRGARGKYKVVKNTLATRAIKGTPFEPLTEHFVGTTAVAYSGDDPGGARQGVDDVREGHTGAENQGCRRAGASDQDGRGHRAGVAARQARAVREAALRAAGADGAAGERAERARAGLDERAGAGGKEEIRDGDSRSVRAVARTAWAAHSRSSARPS